MISLHGRLWSSIQGQYFIPKEDDIISEDGTVDYWKSVILAQVQPKNYKTYMANRVGEQITQTANVPSQLEEIIKQSIKLANSTQ